MNTIKLAVFLLLLLLFLSISSFPQTNQEQNFFYAIESQGIICGYSEFSLTEQTTAGQIILVLDHKLLMQQSGLGTSFTTEFFTKIHLDPVTGHFFFQESRIEQGSLKLESKVSIEGQTAYIHSGQKGQIIKVELPPDVLLENPLYFPHLIHDFKGKSPHAKKYQTFDPRGEAVHEVTYTKLAEEKINLMKREYHAVILDRLNHVTGEKLRIWINSENALMLKIKRHIHSLFLADAAIKENLQHVNIDNRIIAKTGVNIGDYKAISFMKVKSTLEPVGNWITVESLNVPGQSFQGTVENNRIQGIFEIRHVKYGGQNAPVSTRDYSQNKALHKYLEPECEIESHDPVLREQAERITQDAKDSWDAVQHLSQWVDEEISYEVPGGVTARNTYDQRLGECAAHSRLLAAFCRAVGIPARVVWGCMYVPGREGGFGQHAWNEVYMGEAGWIPIDATAKENSFVDSSHIRLGELASQSTAFNPEKMEILDYKAGAEVMERSDGSEAGDTYSPYLGKYRGAKGSFKILFRNGGLAVDIPGKMIFKLNEPDGKGRWYFKIMPQAHIRFERNSSGQVASADLYSSKRLPKKPEPLEYEDNIPLKYRPYLGKYRIPMRQMDYTVVFRENNLAVHDPAEGIIPLTGPDSEGMWSDPSHRNHISFAKDDRGLVKAMIVHSIEKLDKIVPNITITAVYSLGNTISGCLRK
jgi:transglutaminase-like putative cysteine protease